MELIILRFLHVLPSNVLHVGWHNERGDDLVLLLVTEAGYGLHDSPGDSPEEFIVLFYGTQKLSTVKNQFLYLV